MSVPSIAELPKLRPKQALFCMEYIKDFNGTQACIRAGYSPKTSKQMAIQNLSLPSVSAELAALKAERARRLQVSGDEVLQNWVLLNRSSLDDFITEDGSIDIMKATREQRYSLSEYTTETRVDQDGDTIIKTRIKLADRLKASEMVAKHIGLFEADNRQKADTDALTEEEAQAAIVAVLGRMKSPPVLIEDGVIVEPALSPGLASK